ncbi:Cu/Zn superoxide dismutase [Indivirus ILV1]|uniref:Cu/Zn superoxide dismutase n=1 Tax=Indivirus ILV1 TaxID=1977633 RepID=A0A1V0SDD3_9VIRU|nr:Cu/Zn superoxide dismutase [Indivirus ILV1]
MFYLINQFFSICSDIMKAISQIMSANNKIVHGYISMFEDEEKITHFTVDLHHLPPGLHGFHIHEKGDPFACCEKLGSHYNPFHVSHGDKSNRKEMRHVGDLGNLVIDKNGKCFITFTDHLVKLTGDNNVIGRSFVIHEDPDDLGLGGHKDSLTTGHSGKRIAYGIIGIA